MLIVKQIIQLLSNASFQLSLIYADHDLNEDAIIYLWASGLQEINLHLYLLSENAV